jgi:hypothetical protein
MDEYQMLMAERAAKAKRNRLIFGVLAVLVLGGGGFKMFSERKKKAAAQEKLQTFERFAEMDKSETGAFWSCVMAGQIDVGMFKAIDQIQQKIESTYFLFTSTKKNYSEYLVNECVPKIEHARQAMGGLASDAPAEYKEALDKYVASLPKMQAGLETYAERIKGRAAVKDVDSMIQDVGTAFSADVSPEGLAFEKFMYCAIPDLDKKKDIQEVLEFLANTCKKDAIPLMTRVREQCGPLLANIDKDAKVKPSKTWKTTVKKFWEEDARQLQAWEFCGKKSRKGKKVMDLEEFLTAAGDHMEARSAVKQAALDIQAAAEGKAPGEKKAEKAGEGTAPAPEGK